MTLRSCGFTSRLGYSFCINHLCQNSSPDSILKASYLMWCGNIWGQHLICIAIKLTHDLSRKKKRLVPRRLQNGRREGIASLNAQSKRSEEASLSKIRDSLHRYELGLAPLGWTEGPVVGREKTVSFVAGTFLVATAAHSIERTDSMRSEPRN